MHLKQPFVALVTAILLLTTFGCGSGDDDEASSDDTEQDAGSGSGGADDTEDTDDGDVSLPDGWPDELALPEDTTLLEATDLGNDSYTVVARVDGDAQDALDVLEGQLTDAGYEIVNSTFTPSDQGGFGGVSAAGDSYTVAIALGPDPTGDTTQIQISVAQAT
jgi:hypothetical protein